jgi:hypothetical protein
MTLERSTRARLTTALVLTLVLSAGVVLGVALDRKLGARTVAGEEFSGPDGQRGMDRGRGFDSQRSRDPSRPPSEPRDSTHRRPPMILDQLGLSDAQKEKVDSIVGYFRGQMSALHDEFDEAYSTRYGELNRQVREEVRGVMTEGQLMAYDSLRAEWDRHRQERREDSISGKGEGRD